MAGERKPPDDQLRAREFPVERCRCAIADQGANAVATGTSYGTLHIDLDARLAAQQERAQTADVARERAQAALDADRELRAQLDSQLKDTQKRLAAAEKARDAAIATVEQAARGRTPRHEPGTSPARATASPPRRLSPRSAPSQWSM